MNAKFRLLVVAALLCAGVVPLARAQNTHQIRDSQIVLAQQPAALAGSASPLIPPAVSTIKPEGMRRGTTQVFTIEGRNLAQIRDVLFDVSGFHARVISLANVKEKARTIRINVDLGAEVPQGKKQEAKVEVTAPASAMPGIHWLRVQTPLGTSNLLAFDVGGLPEIKTVDRGRQAQVVSLPATLVGAITRPGQVHTYEFTGRAGEDIVFRVVASQLGSSLRSVLTLRNAAGRELAQAGKFSAEPDAVLTSRIPASGRYTVSIADQEQKSGADHFYRLYAGDLPYIASVFPLGVEAGRASEVHVSGVNLDGVHEVTVHPPTRADGWTTIPVRITNRRGEISNTMKLVVVDGPTIIEREPNDDPAEAQSVSVPAVINGHIEQAGNAPDQDYFRFTARKGQRLTIAVAARRLGSPLDSVIEVLDSQGRPISRALVRCLNETSLTLSDRDSRSRGYRLLSRTGFHENDYLMVGEELDQIQYIPDQPDADILLKGFGGLRTALLGTSPEAHYTTEPVYRAEILPPGSKFFPNGLPVFHIDYRNDDGGPGFGADSRLDFVAPAGGQYILHIKDVRGLQGPDFDYQLSIRDEAPDFTLTASTENPNVPRGGRLPVTVTADRMQGYQGPIEVRLVGLPAGISARPAIIPAGQEAVTLILHGSEHAPAWLPAKPFRIEGTGLDRGRKIVRFADPATPLHVAALMPPPDILVAAVPKQIVLRPGQTMNVTIHVTRENGFKGRVPCQVENLPPGVRVVNVGLNGVLVHAGETSHSFTLKAENWARPGHQPIYVVGTVESNSSTQHASLPIELNIAGKQEVASAGAP